MSNYLVIIIFMMLSLYITHISIVDSSIVDGIEVHSTKIRIGKVSRQVHDENEALLLKKFRALLRFRSFITRGHNADISPSPSPAIEPEPPAPEPFHGHSHPAPPRSSQVLPDRAGKGRVERTLVSVLVSVGALFAVCVGALICFKKKGKKSKKIVSNYRNKARSRGKSKNVNSRNSSASSKVGLNPTLDRFYLSTLEMDLEHQQLPKPDASANVNKLSNIVSPKEQNQEFVISETENSSTKEIMTVHDYADGENSSSGDKIILFECNSSDDESFHSFNATYSNFELSNASSGNLSPVLPKSLSSSPTRLPLSQETTNLLEPSLKSPPPPPPPLPPPRPHVSPCKRVFSPKTKVSSVASTLSHLHNSDSSAGSSQSSDRELITSSGIPPPPRPPPFPKGKDNATETPPSQLPLMGKDGTSQLKLKALHWDKVRAAPDHFMVWDELRSSSFEVDEEMMESLFGYNIQSKTKNDEAIRKSPSPTKHVLEAKRLQNITILSKALNASCKQVCSALMKGEGLGVEQLEALSKMVPTKEEEIKLSSYNGDINRLGSAERFVKALLGIPFAFQRVEAMLYRETFEDEATHLRNSFSMLEEACKELRSSKLFLKLLEAVLKTGNRMNVGTTRGGAKAFKLDALLKLADVKGTDKKTTLLHFVVKEIIRSEGIRVSDSIMGQINQKSKPSTIEAEEEDYKRMGLDLVSGLSTELYNVKKTATIDIDVLVTSTSNLSKQLTTLKQLVEEDLSGGGFENSMTWFVNYAERNLRQLQEDERRVLWHVKEITEYFHGNLSKEESNPLRIFVIVRDFLGMLDVVCKELRRVKVLTSPKPLAPFR